MRNVILFIAALSVCLQGRTQSNDTDPHWFPEPGYYCYEEFDVHDTVNESDLGNTVRYMLRKLDDSHYNLSFPSDHGMSDYVRMKILGNGWIHANWSGKDWKGKYMLKKLNNQAFELIPDPFSDWPESESKIVLWKCRQKLSEDRN